MRFWRIGNSIDTKVSIDWAGRSIVTDLLRPPNIKNTAEPIPRFGFLLLDEYEE
jgi:hypothetical protein